MSRVQYRKRVTTPLDGLVHDAAAHVDLDPDETDAVDADVTADGELELKLEGPKDE